MINYDEYLTDLGINEDSPIKNRINKIVLFYNRLIAEDELKDIFLSEFINEDGNRTYTSLWLIYEHKICEAKNFMSEIDLDAVFYPRNELGYWNLKCKDFIEKNPKDTDRMSLHVNFNSNIAGDFQASQNNCQHLLRIFKTYFEK